METTEALITYIIYLYEHSAYNINVHIFEYYILGVAEEPLLPLSLAGKTTNVTRQPMTFYYLFFIIKYKMSCL
jgi:hypothetical protein